MSAAKVIDHLWSPAFEELPWTVWSEWMPDAASVVCTGDQEEESSRLLGRGAVCLFKNHPDNSSDDASLQRSVSVATGLNMVKKQKVKTIFPHTAGANQTLLSFQQGDVITLLISEEKDGWLYGEHDTTKARGWFPSSYTKALEEPAPEAASAPAPSSAPVRSVSTVNLAEKSSVVIPPPDYLECLSAGAAADKKVDASQNTCAFKAPVSKPETVSSPSDANGIAKPPFLRYVSSSTEPFALQVAHPCGGENPFATVKLRPTVTNDRSAPIIR
ncbi:Brain-specific angiogenesis inhibitor 1-associated protein 2-like protein 1 [Camelus dromedarius]|uniref:Brain-specific angiogenesis inhibitor 1-associated protein 2-like protein 1 n=1 Tax=Camelus dromedarius TaxID=9838 RepID=A0A5N4CXD2_CAMDR|nr:Brain-specific angiogenesis inhibitor 1-associated protein 2-like protein 1 [Camelus dromedarius]